MNGEYFKVIPAIILSPFSVASKMIQEPLVSSRENLVKAYQEGIYHFTTEEYANKIMKSQELKASNRFKSYGTKKCFFFGGIPTFETMCVNLKPAVKMTAIKLRLPYEKLVEFDIRSSNDGAITYQGNLDLQNIEIQKVRLGLKEREGELFYNEISEKEYENYQLDIPKMRQKTIIQKLGFKVRTYVTGLNAELNSIHTNMKDERSGIRLLPLTKEDYLPQVSDLIKGPIEQEKRGKAR